MTESWILLLLIFTAALPLILALCWFRFAKPPVTLPWFLTFLAAGIVSLFAAALLQSLVPQLGGGGWNMLFLDRLVRIALIEELSRIMAMVPLFMAASRRQSRDVSFYTALGLTSGLGFAMLESALYGMADIQLTLLRAFTSAPLHGACGIRAAAAVFYFGKYPVKASFLFIFAVLIHGAYNIVIASPAIPSALAVLIAFTALFSSLPFLKTAD